MDDNQFSLDGSDDNLYFNDGYNNDTQSFSRMFNILFIYLF